jgi:NAD(P)H-flavin reductase
MRLKENRQLTDPACNHGVVRLALEPMPNEELSPFTTGQFVRLGIPGVKQPTPAYFAIASSPYDTAAYEFLVKRGSPMADYLSEQSVGAEVEVEGPMGKGFDLTPFKGQNVYLIGVGTGIAPLRSVWRSILQHREEYGHVAIYAGFLTAAHRLLTDEMESLSQHHIDVSVSLETGHEGWSGAIGYVQQALANDAPDGSNAVACLAGMSAMVDACTETLQNLGFDDSRILLNF